MPLVVASGPFTRNVGVHARLWQAFTTNWGGAAVFGLAMGFVMWATWKVRNPSGGNAMGFQTLYDMGWRYSYWGFAGYPLHRDPVQAHIARRVQEIVKSEGID